MVSIFCAAAGLARGALLRHVLGDHLEALHDALLALHHAAESRTMMRWPSGASTGLGAVIRSSPLACRMTRARSPESTLHVAVELERQDLASVS